MATVFDDLLLKGVRQGELPARTQQSREWFRNQAKFRFSCLLFLRVQGLGIGNNYYYTDPDGHMKSGRYSRINVHELPPVFNFSVSHKRRTDYVRLFPLDSRETGG